MMFHNKIPITDLGQQWMDDGIPPDNWYFDFARGGQHLRHTDYLSDHFYQRYCMLLSWMIHESYWDQCIRQPKVSSKEYQFVVNYLLELERDCNFIVPVQLSCYDFPFPLDECEYGPDWSHYPQHIILEFEQEGIKLNPTNPLDDERHPMYNEYQSLRDEFAKQEQLMKPRPKIERVSSSELPSTVIMED